MANFVLQLLRNSAIATDRAAAITALEGKVAGRKDGEMVLARYANGEGISAVLGIINKVDGKNVLTVLEDNVNAVPAKVAEAISSANAKLENAYKTADTAIRGEFAAADTALSNRIATLEGAMGGENAESVGTQITKAIAELDVEAIGGEGKIITSVSELDGKISATAIDATAANIAIADAAGKLDAANVEAALAEIMTKYEAADSAINGKIGNVAEGTTIVEMIEAAADDAKSAHSKVALADGTDNITLTPSTDENGAVTYTIGQTDIASKAALEGVDGRLKTAEGEIDDLQAADTAIRGEFAAADEQLAKDFADADDVVRGEFAAADEQLAKDFADADDALKTELLGEVAEGDAKTIAALNDKIEAVEGAAKSYSIAVVEGEELEALGTNVKEAYKLVDEDSAKAGEYIKIYKDSSLKNVALNGQILNFTYILADGSESTVGVDVSSFLAESEFGNGLQVVDHVVSIKLAEGNENFLTVDADGLKLSGVQTAIDSAVSTAVEGLDATIGEAEVAEDKHVAVQVVEENGVITAVNVKENDIASAEGLAGAVERIAALEGLVGGEEDGSVADQIDTKIAELDAEVTSADGSFVTVKVTEVDGVITAVNVSEENIAKADELDAAEEKIAALETKVGNSNVADQIDAKINALNSEKTADGTFVDVVLKQENGVITSFTIAENNIAKADELDAAEEKIAALEAKVGNTNVSDQIDAKINALDVTDAAVANNYVSSVSETDGKIAVSRNVLVSADADQALSNGTDGGVYMSTTIDCGTY